MDRYKAFELVERNLAPVVTQEVSNFRQYGDCRGPGFIAVKSAEMTGVRVELDQSSPDQG